VTQNLAQNSPQKRTAHAAQVTYAAHAGKRLTQPTKCADSSLDSAAQLGVARQFGGLARQLGRSICWRFRTAARVAHSNLARQPTTGPPIRPSRRRAPASVESVDQIWWWTASVCRIKRWNRQGGFGKPSSLFLPPLPRPEQQPRLRRRCRHHAPAMAAGACSSSSPIHDELRERSEGLPCPHAREYRGCWWWISVNLAMSLPLMLVLIYYSNHWN
jgi:hypothetical protein